MALSRAGFWPKREINLKTGLADEIKFEPNTRETKFGVILSPSPIEEKEYLLDYRTPPS
jgi:hypothetical protein